MLSKDIFVPLTICIDQTRRALVIVLPCYGALEIVGVIIIIIIIITCSVIVISMSIADTQPKPKLAASYSLGVEINC